MIHKIFDFLMDYLFGEGGLDGYYKPSEQKKSERDYVFASVFPNRETMEMLYGQTAD